MGNIPACSCTVASNEELLDITLLIHPKHGKPVIARTSKHCLNLENTA